MPSADTLFCALTHPEMAPPQDFQPTDSVTGITYLEPPGGSPELSVIVPGWHQPPWLQGVVTQRHLDAGRAVLSVGLHHGFLSDDVGRTVASFNVIADRIGEAVRDTQQGTVHWYAASLGGAAALHAIGEQDLPADSITLVTPGCDIASGVWASLRTRPLREALEQSRMNLGILRGEWDHISPLRHARDHIHDTRVGIVLSRADEVIPPRHGELLAEELRRHGNDVRVTYNKYLGHYGTIAYCAFRGVGLQGS
jgi:hypothetical protein